MPLLEAKNITHRFEGLCAVADFNFILQPHELVGIIGPNGAGKTTLFNLITGVYRASEGTIEFAGEELVGQTPHSINKLGIARTFQNIRLFKELTVLDNVRIAYYGKIIYSPLEALLHIGRFRDEEKRIAGMAMELLTIFKLDDMAHSIAGSLPYGLQRKLEIARALALNPKLLLLDEPAAGMNPKESLDLVDLIQHIHTTRGLTIILIEHHMDVVMTVCDRLTVLNFGTKIAEGTPEEIQNNPLVLEAYLGDSHAA